MRLRLQAIDEVSVAMRRIARWDRHVEFLDCSSAFLRPSNDTGTGTALAVDLLPDKLHPNAAGEFSNTSWWHEDRCLAQYIVCPAIFAVERVCKLMPESAACPRSLSARCLSLGRQSSAIEARK